MVMCKKVIMYLLACSDFCIEDLPPDYMILIKTLFFFVLFVIIKCLFSMYIMIKK